MQLITYKYLNLRDLREQKSVIENRIVSMDDGSDIFTKRLQKLCPKTCSIAM
jgi:hypothetical protein